MQHLGTKTLETDRLILRRLTSDDAQAIFKNYASDPEVTTFLTWSTHENIVATKKVVDFWVSHYGDSDFYQWGIILKENGDEPIGTISVVKKDDNTEMIEVGYCLGRKWWHTGVTSEALAALIDFFFEEVKVNRIQARHDPSNPYSGKVMQKCGMKFEGILRKSSRNNLGIRDTAVYAILAEDYLK